MLPQSCTRYFTLQTALASTATTITAMREDRPVAEATATQRGSLTSFNKVEADLRGAAWLLVCSMDGRGPHTFIVQHGSRSYWCLKLHVVTCSFSSMENSRVMFCMSRNSIPRLTLSRSSN